jgi:DNA-binding CsgD family transcriptional regulator
MLIWDSAELGQLTAALDRARSGEPTVLIVEGDAGLGKSALLVELTEHARDFQTLRADGLEGDRTPFTVLAQWAVDPPRPSDGGEPSPRAAAKALQERLDSLALAGPVLLMVDDLHWADPESVEALLWLLRRASGDRMMVAVGTRPLPAELHTDWQRWVTGRDVVVRIVLDGLKPDQVRELARRQWPQLSDDLARRLYEHTGGNPLYLTAVLAENDLPELSSAGMLPAPAAFARTLASRTARLSSTALTFLRAASVLGSGWHPLALVAAVAGTDEAGESGILAQELTEGGLFEPRRVDGPAQLRVSHTLIRASVYQQTPLPQLRKLHLRAAAQAGSRSVGLRHRMAAAEQYDETLAEEMEVYADELYGQRSFRQGAQYLRWASGLTADPAVRERRWLESVYMSVLCYDAAIVDVELDDVRAADNAAWRALVLGTNAIWRRRYRDAVEHLEPIASTPIVSSETRLRYRIEVLLSWARVCLGQPPEAIAAGLARAAMVRVEDARLSGLELIASSQTAIQVEGIELVLAELTALPTAAAVPLMATGELALRGVLLVTLGLIREAALDLAEATRRINDGVTELGAGSYHAYLGLAYWLGGDWGRARVSLHQALDIGGQLDSRGQFLHQMTAALAPLVDISQGRFAGADAAIARTRELLTESPWSEACQLLLTTLLVRVHAGGSATEQVTALARLRDTPFEVTDITRASPILLLNYVPALLWAKRLDDADAAVARLTEVAPAAPWAPAAASWFRGLIAEARGDGPSALRHLTSALAANLDLPLYRAHLLTDHARLAHLVGSTAADSSLRRAEEIYDELGAVPYRERVRAIRSAPAALTRPGLTLAGGVTLTEREQDVLTLVVIGMSYAQISRELFITQSTVGYHLGNMYGKAGVTSRHQLSELARENPQAFGISLASA